MAPPKKTETRLKLIAELLKQLDIEIKAVGTHPAINISLAKGIEHGIRTLGRVFPDIVKPEPGVPRISREVAKAEASIKLIQQNINDLQEKKKGNPNLNIRTVLEKQEESLSNAKSRLARVKKMEKEYLAS